MRENLSLFKKEEEDVEEPSVAEPKFPRQGRLCMSAYGSGTQGPYGYFSGSVFRKQVSPPSWTRHSTDSGPSSFKGHCYNSDLSKPNAKCTKPSPLTSAKTNQKRTKHLYSSILLIISMECFPPRACVCQAPVMKR